VLCQCAHSLLLETQDGPLELVIYYLRIREPFCLSFDIVLICSVLSAFFRNGKVIETVRGDGISQVAIDFTIERLDEGEWVSGFLQYGGHHSMIPDTRISSRICSSRPTRTATRPTEVGHVSITGRTLTGTQRTTHRGRILTEAKSAPTIIPMWIKGTWFSLPSTPMAYSLTRV
jgi:hypothetical protein